MSSRSIGDRSARYRRWRAWSWIVLPPYLLLCLQQWLTGRPRVALFLATQALVVLLLTWLPAPTRRIASMLTAVLLILFTTALSLERLASTRTWIHEEVGFVDRVTSWLSGRQTIDGSTLPRVARSWDLPADISTLYLTFEARHLDGPVGWSWRPANSLEQQSPLRLETGWGTLFEPASTASFIFREYDTGAPLSGRTFRATLLLRHGSVAETGACGRLHLAQLGAREGTHRDLCVGAQWQREEVTWLATPSAERPEITVILNRFASSIEIAEVKLEEEVDGRWHPLDPLAPGGFEVAFSWPDIPRLPTGLRAYPGSEWRRYDLAIDAATLAGAATITARLEVESGVSMETRGVALAFGPSDEGRVRPTATDSRLSAWFAHPNLAGHALTAIAAAHAALAPPMLAVVGTGIGALGVRSTGSRSALAGLAIVVAMVAARLVARRRSGSRWTWAAALLVAAVVVAALVTERREGEEVSRWEIWRFAATAAREHPWTGLGGPEAFAAAWVEATGAKPVHHAHNLWLAFASSYGLPGLLAALWLTVGLALIALRRGGALGLAVVASIFAMNLFDFTLHTFELLLAATLALNTLWRANLGSPRNGHSGRIGG